MATIVIDPGHGGFSNVGGSGWNHAVGPNGTLEKNLTLDVGLRLHAEAGRRGHDAILTRSSDVNLSLARRARVSRDNRADVFVSIHFNASDNHNAQGTETLVHLNYSNLSAQLSLNIQDRLLTATGLKDRNKSYHPSRIKPQNLGVLKPSRHRPDTAACLAEVSFLDRADEEQRLQGVAYRDSIAHSICDGIDDYLGLPVVADVAKGAALEDAIAVAAADAGKPPISHIGLDATAASSGDTDEGSESETAAMDIFSAGFLSASSDGDFLFESLESDTGNYFDDFRAFIAPLGLRYFSADEILYLGGSHSGNGACGGLNSHPPRDLWENIRSTILMLDEVRHRLGAPIRILSGYRNETYNDCVGGASGSHHLLFNALDFTAAAGTPEIWRRIASDVRDSDSEYSGGIGKYISQNFVHIDTRGSNRDWVVA